MNKRKPAGQLNEPLMGSDNQSNSVKVSQIFKIQKEDLGRLFAKGKSLDSAIKQLNEFKGVQAIIKKLATDQNTGIIGDDKDLQRRRKYFGENTKPLRTPPSLFASIKQEATNIMWVGIVLSAIIAGVCGMFVNGIESFVEAISICIVAAVILIITSAADWSKDKRFIALQSLVKDENVIAIRGKTHATISTSVWDIVVGDILLLETGQRVPADCIIIESSDMLVDETPEDESIVTKKKSAYLGKGCDPFLKADSLVIKGSSTVLVAVVGDLSSRGKFATNMNDQLNENTSLQIKLKSLSQQFTLYALFSGLLVLIILIVMTFFEMGYGDNEFKTNTADGAKVKNDNYKGAFAILISKLPQHINLVVVLIVVAIPEGLPLTVGISLAFSVMEMYQNDRILVRKLDAPERMGGCEEILVGKTATLTQNKMKVHTFYLEGNVIKNSRKDTFLHCELNNETIDLVKDSILYNCSANVEMSDTAFVPTGNGTEVGLLNFLQDADIPIHYLIQRKYGRVRAVLPFNSDNKYSAVAIEHPDRPQQISIYIKGAPESLINTDHNGNRLCPQALGEQGIIPINEVIHKDQGVTYLDDFQQKVHVLAGQPLRVIACAYTELHEQDWIAQEENFDTPSQCLKELVQSRQLKFILIGAFGLKDKLRPNVTSCVKYAREHGQMNVRLISGDHMETAIEVARKAGIMRSKEQGGAYAAMDADRFEEQVGGMEQDQEGNYRFGDFEAFQEIMQQLRVISRAKPHHKLMVVAGLQQMNKDVVVTGDGINDVKAIQSATVGLAMGSGCSAAKEVSDMILTGDDFEATLRSVMWGRNIYHNIGRFLQFQVTVNISCLFTVAFGSIWLMESPLSAVQLLWINLIMDTFAAFALSTEPPMATVIKGPPFKSDTQLLTPVIWRQIMGISIWNTIVMILLIIFGPLISNLPYTVTDTANGNDNKRKHMTLIFNTFVMMQLFNEINCRKVGRRDFNVFESMHHNIYFVIVVLGTFLVQLTILQWFPFLFRAVALETSEWGGCIVIGATPLLISVLLKLSPESWLAKIKIDKLVNEDKDMSGNAILDKYDKGSKLKVDAVQKAIDKAEGQKTDTSFEPVK